MTDQTPIEKIRAEVERVRIRLDIQQPLSQRELLNLAEDKLKLAEALWVIASADPDAPEVESWKWLARHLMERARTTLAEVSR